ncbi:hypothetical protein [Mesonia maritima]|uniref:Type I restriction enzyme R protein N-terminal domain-containing protein n=2 Tax=Mesonia maritima TaxID=1793873 RepID=A0ABU1K4V4_9FLAO|nr:hypothetical protein [Mesonia maritima]MDR6300633.1 hypothetical protein [Mesonia maritima]
MKEEEIKSRFLTEFFGDVLGFNYGNSLFWTLREEKKSKTDGKKVDGALGYFYKDKIKDDVRAVIEIKDANTHLDNNQKRKDSRSPINQAFDYALTMGESCKWVIVSNIKEIRFYSSRYKGKYQVYYLEELENEEKLKELLYLFHKDRFISQQTNSKADQLYKIQSSELKENENPRHIVDEIYTSLTRFKGLNYIDPEYIASIKPFNILNEYVWHYYNGKLLTLNNNVFQLFNHIDVLEGKVKLSDELIHELKERRVIDFKAKIIKSLEILNYCGIWKISCVEDYKRIIIKKSNTIGFSHKHFFPFSEKDGFTKNINIIELKNCDCISCNFRSLDFDHLLRKLKLATYNENEETFEYAYGNFLVATDNSKKAFNIYKRISENIKGKEGSFVKYFLAKLNIKYLHNLVWEDEKLQDSFQIKDEIRNLDLNRVLYEEIEYNISDEVRNYLVKVKEEKLFLSVKKKVNELVDRIIDIKKYFERQNRGFIGSQGYQELGDQYLKLLMHFHNNRIVFIRFSEYKALSAKVFKGFIESYLTKNQGIPSLSSFYLIEFILSVRPPEFQKIINKVDVLKLDEGDDKIIVNHISNLLKSYFEDPAIAFEPYKNRVLEEYLIDMSFKEDYTSFVTNSFTLLAKMELSKTLFASLSNIIIKFLKVEDDLSWYNLKEVGQLISYKGYLFSEDQFVELLKIIINKDKTYNNKYEQLIKETSLALYKFYPSKKISNKNIVKKLVANTESVSKWRSVIFTLKILDKECSKILMKEIEYLFESKMEFVLYEDLLRNNFYDYRKKDYFERYIDYINQMKRKGFKGEFYNGKPVFNDYYYFHFIILLNLIEIDRNSKVLKKLTNLSEYEKWLLNPKEFNYSNFDAKWILAADNIYILKSLQNISDISIAIEIELRKEFNSRLSQIYYEYFQE